MTFEQPPTAVVSQEQPNGPWVARCGCGWSQAYNNAASAKRQAVWHSDMTGHKVQDR